DVESEPGKGSTFHVGLKLAYDSIAGLAPPQWQSALTGVRVMVIEPHPTTRFIIGEILAAHGIVPELYGSVADALQPSIREAFSCVVIDAATLASTPWISPVPIVQVVSPTSTVVHPTVTFTPPIRERELFAALGMSPASSERRVACIDESRR